MHAEPLKRKGIGVRPWLKGPVTQSQVVPSLSQLSRKQNDSQQCDKYWVNSRGEERWEKSTGQEEE